MGITRLKSHFFYIYFVNDIYTRNHNRGVMAVVNSIDIDDDSGSRGGIRSYPVPKKNTEKKIKRI